jgi:predicted ArsR family transcriptional regulator
MSEDKKDQDKTINMMVSKIEALIGYHIHSMDVRRHVSNIISKVSIISEILSTRGEDDSQYGIHVEDNMTVHDDLLTATKDLITLMRDPLGKEAIELLATDRTSFVEWDNDFDSVWFINSITVD